MDLNKLIACHQIALHEMADGIDDEVRRWAGERADYYAERILASRIGSNPSDFSRMLA